MFVGNDGQRNIIFLQVENKFFIDFHKDKISITPLNRIVKYTEMNNKEIQLTFEGGGTLDLGHPHYEKGLLKKFLKNLKEEFLSNEEERKKYLKKYKLSEEFSNNFELPPRIRFSFFPHVHKENSVVIIDFNGEIKMPLPAKKGGTSEKEISPDIHVKQKFENPSFWNKLGGFEKVTEINGKKMAIKEYVVTREGKKTISDILKENLK